ncbi:hypothetical protein J3B02_005061 [Coemansia erecta]|uniref:6,7-dimethyl-8-ribityllumazine synthase n=1 Tax=Coemansia asiatica TaxID=1052880 RepID=A0A9W8CKB1_9FUNG|nr:hypothetical protein LPJ64_002676 [Coemansia asiatica]KAJ2844120.1 hypothetical protein J3B02_005061 [Coemansia erecta]KAJ2885544.1 hypothetical protein FB639_001753 [Coemansia asiatica]
MKAVSSFRTRRRAADSNDASSTPQVTETPTMGADSSDGVNSLPGLRRRACTSSAASSDAAAFLSPPLSSTEGGQRAWAVVPRKLRGLHPSPVIIYARENTQLVTLVMDKLYATLVSTYGVDSRDIRVADVPTAYDLPLAVRRMGRDKHMVVVVGLLTRDKAWFDQGQVDRVREYLLAWSEQICVPLIDGILVDSCEEALLQRICCPEWNVVAGGDNVQPMWLESRNRQMHKQSAFDDASSVASSVASSWAADNGSSNGNKNGCGEYLFGHYLAHRAMEMFYVEHRGW